MLETFLTDLHRENQAMRVLIADLVYGGIERGYTRGSLMWAIEVRCSAGRAGLSEAEADLLIDGFTDA